MTKAVEIFRDALGIPHVRAGSTHDAFFGQGYVHAQDRLWHMCYDRARAAGRLAEWLGPRAVRMDVFCRRLGLDETSRADYETFDTPTREVLDAYASGVNAFIERAAVLPVEFGFLGVDPEPWLPWQCGAVMKVRHVLMGSYDRKLWRAQLARTLGADAMVRIGSPEGREDTLIVPVGGRAKWSARSDDLGPGALASAGLSDGSNNWAVHGSRTASGLPLVAGDPHRALEVPNVYFQNHVACPEFDAIGFSMPGVPGMFHFAHNADVAWCVTHAMADTQDLYTEHFDDECRYEFRGGWLPATRSEEVVRVRDADDVTLDITRTHHGPVVFGDWRSGTAMTMRWTGTDVPNSTLSCLLPMLRATSVDELEEAMRPWVDPCNNLVMADTHGTIAYLHRGRVPIRPPANGWAPVPGWTGEHEWEGDVPFEELPRLRDPDTGYIVTANNRVCGEEFPRYLAIDYGGSYRAIRVLDRLSEITSATAQDMADVHADRVSLPAELFIDSVRKVVAWDGLMDPDGAGAAVYAVLREELAMMLLEHGPLADVATHAFPDDPMPVPAVYRVRIALPRLIETDDRTALVATSWQQAMDEAMKRALAVLEEEMGPDRSQWRWDRIHRTRMRHPLGLSFPELSEELDPPSVSCGGDSETVNVSGWQTGLGVQHSSVARYVFDLGDWDSSGWSVPLGSSGDPRSRHYTDQAERWAKVELYLMTYSWGLVESGAESHETLDPRAGGKP
jgi:penicillin amidase